MPRRAQLHAVREAEGNQQKKAIPEGVKLPPEAPPEPNWLEPFPPVKVGRKPSKPPAGPGRLPAGADDNLRIAHAQARIAHLMDVLDYRAALRHHEEQVQLRVEAKRCREVARIRWRELVGPLDRQGLLARIDEHELRDAAVLMARLDQAERDISRRGLNVEGERGLVKNPSVTAANGFREKLRAHVGDFGLSPAARDKLNPREGPDADDLFD